MNKLVNFLKDFLGFIFILAILNIVGFFIFTVILGIGFNIWIFNAVGIFLSGILRNIFN